MFVFLLILGIVSIFVEIGQGICYIVESIVGVLEKLIKTLGKLFNKN